MEIRNLQNKIVYTFEYNKNETEVTDGTLLTGKRVCLSGYFVKGKKELEKYIKKVGAFIDVNVHLTTDYFVKGNSYSIYNFQKALANKIHIINDVDFYSLLRQCGVKNI